MQDQEINVVQGDYGYSLPFTLTDSAGNPANLANATLQFQVQRSGTSALKFSRAIAIDNASAGTCHYATQQGDFDQWGRYVCAIVVTFQSGEVLTYPNIVVNADPQLPRNF